MFVQKLCPTCQKFTYKPTGGDISHMICANHRDGKSMFDVRTCPSCKKDSWGEQNINQQNKYICPFCGKEMTQAPIKSQRQRGSIGCKTDLSAEPIYGFIDSWEMVKYERQTKQ